MKDYFGFNGDFHDLPRKDLEYFFLDLNHYRLRYRATLSIDEKISFAPEIEFEDVLLYFVNKELNKKFFYPDWKAHQDDSCTFQVDNFDVGGEISSPVLHDTEIDWETLREVLEMLRKMKAHATSNTGFHVHVGSQILGEEMENVFRFVKVWCIFEHVIFRFAYGKDSVFRPNIICFSQPICDEALHLFDYVDGSFDVDVPLDFDYDKTKVLNFSNFHHLTSVEEVNNTIEIRCANGTLDANIAQNTIYFYLKLMLFVTSERYDEEFIDYLFAHLESKSLDQYNELFIRDALLLVDLVFDQAFDKIQFLKQYVKSNETVFVR